jgi:hypothetical protein
MTGVAEQPDELRTAIGEVGALATLTTAASCWLPMSSGRIAMSQAALR